MRPISGCQSCSPNVFPPARPFSTSLTADNGGASGAASATDVADSNEGQGDRRVFRAFIVSPRRQANPIVRISLRRLNGLVGSDNAR